MVSYATDGAGVGPHFDQYDVFLLQGQANGYGRLGLTVMLQRLRLTRTGLHLSKSLIQIRSSCSIREMRCTFRLDMPIGDCDRRKYDLLPWFQSTSRADLVARLSDSVIESLRDGLLLEDKGSMRVQPRPGEITDQHLANAQTAVVNAIEALSDTDWFPELLSETDEDLPINEEPISDIVALVPSQRLLWRDRDDHLAVFLAGRKYRLASSDEAFVTTLSSGQALMIRDATAPQLEILKRVVVTRLY